MRELVTRQYNGLRDLALEVQRVAAANRTEQLGSELSRVITMAATQIHNLPKMGGLENILLEDILETVLRAGFVHPRPYDVLDPR